MRAAERLGLGEVFVEDHQSWAEQYTPEEVMGNMAYADAHFYYGAPSLALEERVNMLVGLEAKRSAPYGTLRQRPTIIWTLDDNYHHVSPLNQAFLWNGYRAPDGTILGRGDDLVIPMPDGKLVTLWAYGERYAGGKRFQPEKNRKRMLAMDDLLRKVDGVHFPAEGLRSFYKDFARLPNTYVYPNSILFEDYDLLHGWHAVRDDPDEIKVLWQGGSSHFGDLLSVQSGIERLTRKYPKLRWIIWGARFPWFDRVIPDNQFEMIPWVSYSAYKPMLATLDFDFAIAPLVKSPFNEGKSSIKYYEPAALPRPKPSLVARCLPYTEDMLEGETVLAYEPGNNEEFFEKAEALIQDAQLRQRLASRCHEWLRDERDALKTTVGLVNWVRETRETSRPPVGKELGALLASRNSSPVVRELMKHA